MSLLRELLAAKPVRTPLEFGINENIKLIAIDNAERKRDGEVIQRNTHMKFARFNSKGEVIANTEFNYFDLDPDSDYVEGNFAKQVAQLNNIANILNPGSVIDPTEGYENFTELKADLGTKKGCKKLMDETWKQFNKAVKKFVGPDSIPLRIKIITNKDGKYLQLPQDAIIAESMEIDSNDSSLTVQPFELKNKEKASNNIATPDAKGDAPGAKPTTGAAVINI